MSNPFLGNGGNSRQSFSEIFKKVRGRKAKSTKTLAAALAGLPGELCHQFSLAELKAATKNFANSLMIGTGGFGCVYKGLIDGRIVAFKCRTHSESVDYEFQTELRVRQSMTIKGGDQFRTEIQLLCQLSHQNLVSLIGFCQEKDDRIIVYEYLTHGSLRDHLNPSAHDPLPWKRRLEICIGVARGLHYLHTSAKYAIIHRDVKSANILLDKNWAAKLADFGLAKIGPRSISKPKALTQTESEIAGTYGYMAPEYRINGELTEKCDVFSLGVVLFEVLCGRLAHQFINFTENLVPLCFGRIGAASIHDIIDPYLKGKIAPACLTEFVGIAFSCLHAKASERPSAGEVEVMLELALEKQDKTDSIMQCVNPRAVYAYEEITFHELVPDYDRYFSGRPNVTDSYEPCSSSNAYSVNDLVYCDSSVGECSFSSFEGR
ncbi:hypothetical protein SLEP1_g57733 [Rubroshorea leprosula]|uniref:non-specific serine/threonine protein kinase n=1 Tax=Rubroshorea leprosula TaxID=152421 RepID=A0AAV5MRN5_9ROSI|nr:hypothetical protein SLEP1_g57733 [Rubroshorea leprosula]